jgi:hypothetical protein
VGYPLAGHQMGDHQTEDHRKVGLDHRLAVEAERNKLANCLNLDNHWLLTGWCIPGGPGGGGPCGLSPGGPYLCVSCIRPLP